MTSPYSKVLEFHEKFGVAVGQPMTTELCKLRRSLIQEECWEVVDALCAGNIIAIADGLADLVYVAYGAAITFGIDLDAVLDAVHESNMSKLGKDGKPIYREDGKVLKGPDYHPPVITNGMINKET